VAKVAAHPNLESLAHKMGATERSTFLADVACSAVTMDASRCSILTV
jgi:hypothetical protein